MTLSFGKYRGKTLDFVVNQPDGVEHLNWYIKRLNNYIENDNFKKYKETNISYKQQIENVLNNLNNEDELQTDTNTLVEETKIEIEKDTINEEEVITNTTKMENKIEVIKENKEDNKNKQVIDLSVETINNTNDFDKLVVILEELLLSKLDEKFRKSYNISKHYRDYVCLKITLKTYDETIKERNISDIKHICIALV